MRIHEALAELEKEEVEKVKIKGSKDTIVKRGEEYIRITERVFTPMPSEMTSKDWEIVED